MVRQVMAGDPRLMTQHLEYQQDSEVLLTLQTASAGLLSHL